MSAPPPNGEPDFLKRVENFAELKNRLVSMGLISDLTRLTEYAHHITECWFKLGEQHLSEARAALTASLHRTVFSRAYYAAYNASKAVRYITKGSVSLRGDDHKAAPDLPSDFVDAATWARRITVLYEHRLRSDYDNWTTTTDSHTITPAEAAAQAGEFIRESRKYLKTKFGINL